MAANTNINIAGLEFDQIKTNLKNYLRGQSQFSDYDFDGSAMSILIDLLAYNTHYQSYYLNMLANESFLDTASIRSSVVSHAKALGYTPKSVTSALARVSVEFNGASYVGNVLTLPRFTKFITSNLDGKNFIFNTVEEVTATKDLSNKFVFSNLVLREGQPVTKVFAFNSITNPKSTFLLSDTGIDISTIEVTVQTSSSELTQARYVLATDATVVDSTAKVYFIDEVSDGKYSIYFGDDIIGKALSTGNIVIVSYLTSSGDSANKSKVFTLVDAVGGMPKPTVTTVQVAAAGSPPETTDSVRFAAPKNYISNNRAVTKNDYIALINRKYPYFDAVTVWGGEDNSPPIYGKVFISAKPKDGFEITESEKEYLKSEIIKPLSVLTVTPEFVDVDYNYLNLFISAQYDPTLTNKTAGQVESSIATAVITYVNQNLNSFNSTFKSSRLTRAIDDSENSILGCDIEVLLEKKFRPTLNQTRNYTLAYDTPLKRGGTFKKLYSSPSFTHRDQNGIERTCFIEETPSSFSGIEEVEVIMSGTGYTETPTLTINGDGTGAELQAVIVNGVFQSVRVISPGSNYTVANITINGGNGSGAVLKSVLQGRTGILRIYYFDDNLNKIILNDNLGVIDYVNGIITLKNFTPTSIQNDQQVLTIHVEPESLVFSSQRNKIITLDSNDVSSLSITVTQVKDE